MSSPQHDALVQRAARWLAGTKRCIVVLAECGAYCANQQPDAIGWVARGHSIVVEVKVSISDLMADKRKPAHRGGRSLGYERWYLTPPHMIDPERIPNPWGLLEARGERIRIIKKALPAETHHYEEMAILLGETRRVAEGWRDRTDKGRGLLHAAPLRIGADGLVTGRSGNRSGPSWTGETPPHGAPGPTLSEGGQQ